MEEKVSEDLHYFVWKIPEQGFHWSWKAEPIVREESSELEMQYQRKIAELGIPPSPQEGGPWPVNGPPFLLQKSTTAKIYKPLESNPALFLEFLDMDLTQDAILKFANTYGLLSEGRPFCVNNGDTILLGESLYFWLYAKAEMSMLFSVDRWIQEKNRIKLTEVIRWRENGNRVEFRYIPSKAWTLHNFHPPSIYQLLGEKNSIHPEFSSRWKRWKEGDVIAPASALLTNRINKELKGTSLRLLINDNQKITSYIHPRTLLDALWLQFSQLIVGQRRLQPCKVCKKWMDVTDFRRDKSVHPKCSRRERQRVWRENQKIKVLRKKD